jgi:sulfite oxidase
MFKFFRKKEFLLVCGGGILSTSSLYLLNDDDTPCILDQDFGHRPLKKYTYEEISKHTSKENGIWVTYKDSVFDITDFINNHPGGKDKIMLAAGKGIEPYWDIYKQHTNNESIVNDILNPMRIGFIKEYDKNKYNNVNDPYIKDPTRSSDLNYHSVTPCNAETPLDEITNNWITPNDLWYIRNHNPVPNIDINKYKLNISSTSNDYVFTIDELKKLKSKKIITTMQCGGNRRNNLNDYKKTSGTLWNIGAISTAEWKGVPLRDIIIQKGLLNDKIKHIQIEGIDGVKASIPIEKVMNIYGDVLLAYEMNGEDIPRDHGYPLRIIVPGHVGIRNIKWIKNIILSKEEAEGTWQKGISYKGIPHYIDDVNNINIDDIAPIQEMPIQSCITNITKSHDEIIAKGFAWSGGGRGIIRVDVSFNDGKTWKMANLKEGRDQPFNKAWAWTFWEAKIDIPKDKVTVCCKAIDSSYNTQPEKQETTWNIRGLNNNSWHKIKYP